MFTSFGFRRIVKAMLAFNTLLCLLASHSTHAQETICAEVQIEIEQELTIERQAFEANLTIENTLTDQTINDINVVVEFSDSDGNPVLATSSSADSSADFFIRVTNLDGIDNIEGSGSLAAAQTANVTWLIIPAPGASDGIPSGKLIFIGARFEYTLDGRDDVIEVAPDTIYVRPLPLLGLDYFIPRDVFADDPLTDEVEAVEPFTLGVRVQNNGTGVGNSIKIESAQPRIVDNEQGLSIEFRLLDSFVQDQEVSNSLLIDFGDIPGGESRMGRWIMSTSLSGIFTEFDAEFTHEDELGGELTSLLDSVNTHFLLRDVLVDVPGRDSVKDFLSFEIFDELTDTPEVLQVFESNSTTMPVENLSNAVNFEALSGETDAYRFQVNPHAGFMYARTADPFDGSKVITRALRSDGKVMNLNNVWISRNLNRRTDETDYFINVFDANTTGEYTIFLETPVFQPRPPIWQQVPFRSTVEGQTLGFIVQASDPDGTTPVLTALNLPAGASFSDNGNGFGSFQWTPLPGQAGQYTVSLVASDGVLSSAIDMFIGVNSAADTDGDGLADDWELENFGTLDRDGTGDFDNDGVSDLEEFENGTDPNTQDAPLAPIIVAPLFEATIDNLQPELVIQNSEYDGPLTVVYVFEVYSDPAYAADDLVAAFYSQAQGDDGETSWLVSAQLEEDQDYFWRVRATNSFTYSPWVDGRFRVNSENAAPSAPLVNSPADGAEVNADEFNLVVTNASDADGDALSYQFFVYEDLAGSILLEESAVIAQQDMGTTQWQPSVSLLAGVDYYWQAFVSDGIAEPTASQVSSFRLTQANQAPGEPVILMPQANERVDTLTPTVTISVASDDQGRNNLSYLFEVDSSNTFDSLSLISSGLLAANGNDALFTWSLNQPLLEDQVYFLRVRARDVDGLESAWVVSSFRVNASNTVPDVPVAKNPGDQSQVITLEPKLEVHPVIDVDGDTLEYEFQLSSESTFTSVLQTAIGVESETMLTALEDDRVYFWRARAIDETGAESDWSDVSEFFVNENNFDDPPSFTWLLPEGETSVQAGELIDLRWQDEDPDSSATISLFYADNSVGTNLQTIVDSINEDDDVLADTYQWNTAGLAPGDYYLFATIEDASSSEGVAAEELFVITIEDLPLTAASIILPQVGATLVSSTETFQWTNADADTYVLAIGTTAGESDIALIENISGSVTEIEVNDLPIDGSEFYVRLTSIRNSVEIHSDSGPYNSVLIEQSCSDPTNIASLGVASQSSIWNSDNSFPASLGNNGITTDFTHTAANDSAASWELSFAQPRDIQSLVIHNRDGCCQERLRDIVVTAEDSAGVELYRSALLNPENQLAGPATLNIELPANIIASKVKVERISDPDLSGGGGNAASGNILSLGEVEVLSCSTAGSAPQNLEIQQPDTLIAFTNIEAGLVIDVEADSNAALTFSDSNLPSGMSINPETGFISGVASTVGSFIVTVEVSQGTLSDSVSFTIEVLDGSVSCTAPTNVAPAGVAAQSSNWNASNSFPASNGNNGITTDITHTAADDDAASWELIFNQPQEVQALVLHNRDNCCQERLRDIVVSAEDASGIELYRSSIINPENYLSGPETLTVGIPANIVASRIKVERISDPDLSGGGGNAVSGNILSLGEVEVLSCISEVEPIAPVLQQPETLSVSVGEEVSLAIEVDAEDSAPLSFSATGLPAGLSIAPETGLITGVPSVDGDYSVTVNVSQGELGDSLTFNIEVLSGACETPSNIALSGVATQSSNWNANNRFPASFGNNGINSDFTHTAAGDSAANWQLTLASSAQVQTVILHNRDGCCADRLRDIVVTAENSQGVEVFRSALINPENVLNGPDTISVNLDAGVTVNRIKVERISDPDLSGGGGNAASGNILSLGEVEVLACSNP